MTALRSYHEIPCYSKERQTFEGWMNLTEAARLLEMGPKTLRLAAERGEIEAQHPLPDGPRVSNRRVLASPGAARFLERVARSKRSTTIPMDGQATLDFSST